MVIISEHDSCPDPDQPDRPRAASALAAALATALFASGLQSSDDPSVAQVRRAVTAATRAFGRLGCAARLAQEFGDHPEAAAIRMRWARVAVDGAFARPLAGAGTAARAGGTAGARP